MSEDKQVDVVLGKGGAFVTIHGNRYDLSPLKLDDFAEFRSYVKKERLAIVFEAARESGVSLSDMASVIEGIASAAPKDSGKKDEEGNPVVEDAVIEAMSTESGLQYLIYLSIRKKHPEITTADLDLGYKDLSELSTILSIITGLPTGEEEKKDTVPPESKP